MSLFSLIRDYIAALREQTAATVAATAVARRSVEAAAWERYQAQRIHSHGHHHCEPHHGGNASLPGGCV